MLVIWIEVSWRDQKPQKVDNIKFSDIPEGLKSMVDRMKSAVKLITSIAEGHTNRAKEDTSMANKY